MRLKEEYKQKNIFHNGVRYDLSKLSEEKLKMIYDNTPALRYAFEEKEPKVESEEDEFFKNMPADKTEEEFFNESIKKVVRKKPNTKNK